MDKIFTIQEAYCLLEIVKMDYDNDNIYSLTDFSTLDYRDIFMKIIEKGGSLKDIDYIFERIVNYSKTSNDKDFIAFSVCQDVAFNYKK